MAVVAEIDPRTPSIARVYDYLLDGTDNFPADREVAQRLLAVALDAVAGASTCRCRSAC
jgi:hypothetical protein